MSSANVWWSVCGLYFGLGWAIKALKGCRNIMSSQQGQTLVRKSLSCTLAHLPYIFIHMKGNVTLSMITNALSHALPIYYWTRTQVSLILFVSFTALAPLNFHFVSSQSNFESHFVKRD